MQLRFAMWSVLVALLSVSAIPIQAQNFSCRIGTRAACLDYGDQVCSSSGKCVDSDAACFNAYQCDYEGFTCKSNVTDCAEQYDALLLRFNTLVDDHNEQLRQKIEVIDEYDDLVTRYNRLVSDAAATAVVLDEIRSCLIFATDLSAAQACGY